MRRRNNSLTYARALCSRERKGDVRERAILDTCEALLAQKGYEANPDVMEHRFGYAAVYGEEMMNLNNVTRHLGNPWGLMGTGREVANGISIKIWPCCGGTHGANTAMTHLLKKTLVD